MNHETFKNKEERIVSNPVTGETKYQETKTTTTQSSTYGSSQNDYQKDGLRQDELRGQYQQDQYQQNHQSGHHSGYDATTEQQRAQNVEDDLNRDPITGEPGSHPVGTGIGTATAGTIGAVGGGIIGGPIGAAVGAAAGGVAGAIAGHSIAEKQDPTISPVYGRTVESGETDFNKMDPSLRSDFMSRPYARDENVQDYQSAYAYGSMTRREYDYNCPTDFNARSEFEKEYGRPQWDDKLEASLKEGWEKTKNSTRLSFDKAKLAIKDAWHATERVLPGDFDRDGR